MDQGQDQGQGQGAGQPGVDGIDPVARGLALIRAGLETILSARGWSTPDRDLLLFVKTLARLRSQGDAAHLHLLRMIEERESARATGAPSTAAWLRVALRLAPGRAKADVDAAHAADPVTGSLAVLGAALARGDISREHLDTAVRTLGKIPTHLRERVIEPAEAEAIAGLGFDEPVRYDESGQVVESGQDSPGSGAALLGRADTVRTVVGQWLLDQSIQHHPLDVARLSRHVLAVADPSGQERFDPRAFERRYLRLGVDSTGMTFGSFQLDASAAIVKTMIDFLATPDTGQQVDAAGTVEPMRDNRLPEQRRADGFVEMAKLAAAHVQGERTRAAEPPLVLVHATQSQVGAALGLADPPAPAPRPPVGAAAESADPPVRSPGLATCEQTGPLAPWALRRLACDASWQLVLMSDGGAPLWLGRSRRFASREQRRALAARDRGCAHPGCQRPTSWCEVHHAPGWTRGSPTDIDVMVLLCSAHHTLCDLGVWQIEFVDGIPWFIPPSWVASGATTDPQPLAGRRRSSPPARADPARRPGSPVPDREVAASRAGGGLVEQVPG